MVREAVIDSYTHLSARHHRSCGVKRLPVCNFKRVQLFFLEVSPEGSESDAEGVCM